MLPAVGLLQRMFALVDPAPVHVRAIDSFTDYPGLTDQLLAAQGAGAIDYRLPSIREALGVPSIWRAVSLLSNTGAALPLEAYRDGERLPPALTPRLVARPNPFTTRRAFFRQTIYYLATRGEAIWWISARDTDGAPISLIPLSPAEVRVRWARGLEGVAVDFTWRDRPMPREDIVHLTFMRDGSSPRGVGPLQLCGGAVSVALESMDWAANLFGGGGVPSVILKWPGELTSDEAAKLKSDWSDTPSNQPKVASGGLEPEDFGLNPEQAAYVGVRQASTIDAATMFGIPGHLLNASVSGSSLTYQNLSEVATELVRFTLWPGYLEPIEQAMTDLLPRAITTRFDIDQLQRPAIETRYTVHTAAIDAGVYDAEYARQLEGLAPGGSMTAPIPPSPPSAFPTGVPTGAP